MQVLRYDIFCSDFNFRSYLFIFQYSVMPIYHTCMFSEKEIYSVYNDMKLLYLICNNFNTNDSSQNHGDFIQHNNTVQ